MAKKLYVGVGDFAKQAVDISIGVNSIAQKAKKIYIGDENGIAKLVYDNTPTELIVRPFVRYGKNYPDGAWESNISAHGRIEIYNTSSTKLIRQYGYTDHQVVSYYEFILRFADGREVNAQHYTHNTNKNVVVNMTSGLESAYYGYPGGNIVFGGTDNLKPNPWQGGTYTTRDYTVKKDFISQSIFEMGTVYKMLLYISAYGNSNGYVQIRFNSCNVDGVSIPITVEDW